MKSFLSKPVFLLVLLSGLLFSQAQGQQRGKDCGESCFSSEIISVDELSDGCLRYTLLVSAGSDCASALSHFSVDVPCGTVADITNTGGWKIASGEDPTSGLDGFKIDDISGFGEDKEAGTFEVSFTVCPEADCDAGTLACWQPKVAYKASTCVYFEELAVQCSKLDAILVASDVTCGNASDGTVSVEILEGTEPYAYQWSHDENLNGSVASGLNAGMYTVIVSDGSGETVELSTEIQAPSAMEVTALAAAATCSGNSDGGLDVTASGGTAPYSYSWSHGPETEDLNGIAPGIYILTVTDNRGCSVAKAFTVGVENEIMINGQVGQTGCSDATGSIDATVSGGTGNYTFEWSNGALSEDLTGIGEGIYTLTVTDDSGCSAQRNFYVTAKNTLRISASRTNTSCIEDNSGTIDLTVSGGTAPYTYEWSTGDAVEDIDGLAAGFYQVTVTDAEGCSSSLQIVIGTNTVNVTGQVNNPSCTGTADGSIQLTPGQNEGPLTYAWSTGASGSSITGLAPGVYSVTVSNEDGCEKVLTYVVSNPAPAAVSSSVSNTSCTDGEFSVDISVDGNGTYDYAWDDGAQTEDRSGLTEGTYTVYITDENGCTQEHIVEVNLTAANCTDTEEPTDPTDPDQPTDPDNPDNPDDPNNPDNPDNPENPENPEDPENPENPSDCGDPYDAELTLVARDGNCFSYEMTVTYNGAKSYGLSHMVLEVPCGDIRDVRNSEGWKIVEGTDPKSGLDGIKIDDISGFGEGSMSDEFTVTFTVCGDEGECTDALEMWEATVAFKYGQCLVVEDAEESVMMVEATAYPNPFSSSVTINYEASSEGMVRVEIFSESGVKKADLFSGTLEGGEKTSWTWVPESNIQEGVYLYRVTSEQGVRLGKILLLR